MRKLLLLLFVPILCFGQNGDPKYIGEGEYRVSISSGLFSVGTSWVPKKKRELNKKIQKFANSVQADSYKIVNEYIEPTHSGGRNGTFGALDLYFVLLDNGKVREFNSNGLKGGIKDTELTNETESSLTEYYDTKSLHPLEGIYKSGDGTFTIGIKKYDKLFKGIVIDSNYPHWKVGEVKVVFNFTATSEVYSITYYMNDKSENNSFARIENNGLLSIPINNIAEVSYVKMYPANTNTGTKISGLKSSEWAGNGSGIIISKSGYIVTNHHVIEDTDDIEVEFIVDGEVQKFNAEIVQSDKVNDLAIIKIFDMNFDGLDNLLYNFKTRSSDVGTKVYAYGYPMALSLMGKEIKITDGIISSKSGFDGDVTSYQISAPIQAGNSGGPLFDDRGNFIGINSAGLRKEVADNVGYTIKSSYVLNLIDVLPKSIDLPSSTKLQSLPLTEQIKEISKYVVLVKVK